MWSQTFRSCSMIFTSYIETLNFKEVTKIFLFQTSTKSSKKQGGYIFHPYGGGEWARTRMHTLCSISFNPKLSWMRISNAIWQLRKSRLWNILSLHKILFLISSAGRIEPWVSLFPKSITIYRTLAIQSVFRWPQDFASTGRWIEMQNQSLLEIYWIRMHNLVKSLMIN